MPDRGNFFGERVVYAESFQLKVKDGSTRSGRFQYKVSVGFHAYESGNANWPDDRACHFDPIERKLERDIVIKSKEGVEQHLANSLTVLPSPGGRSWNHPCNDYLGDGHNDMPNIINEALGSKQTWQSYIDNDKQQVEALLDLIGEITSRNVDV